jgi:hypothetical protein
MKLPQHGVLFLMVMLRALEDVRKNTDSSYGVGSFVEHNAFGALAHGGVGGEIRLEVRICHQYWW